MVSKSIWIVLAEVESVRASSGLKLGEKAFVNVLVPACPNDVVEEIVRNELLHLGFHLISMQTPERWDDRFKSRMPDDDLRNLAAVASTTSEVQFGAFHTWDNQG